MEVSGLLNNENFELHNQKGVWFGDYFLRNKHKIDSVCEEIPV
jgi:hypothetical protein